LYGKLISLPAKCLEAPTLVQAIDSIHSAVCRVVSSKFFLISSFVYDRFLKEKPYMKTLIVEDDFTCRLLLQEILKNYGPAHVAMDGKEAVEAVRVALEAGEPYNLITMDIMMPEMDGQEALHQIRLLEEARGIASIYGARVIMTTTLDDSRNVLASFKSFCDAYVIKPVNKEKLLGYIKGFGLIQ
jgi:two-component system chemotaxis response regulator CheY